jgi:predicted MFS family arabinose efflux permease
MTGLRSLFPILVPPRLWERANALDSNAFVTAAMAGPVLAAGSIAVLGPPGAMIVLAIPYGLAVLALRGVRTPIGAPASDAPVLRSALAGIGYVWRNPTLRGLAVAIATRTFAGGIISIVVPLIVLRQLGASELAVGIAFAMSGLSGMVSVLVVGRIDSRGREWRLMVVALLLLAPLSGLLLLPAGSLGLTEPLLGFAVLCLTLLLIGLLEGPLDIGLFTIRQRRTATAWIGRAFAISMAVNALGYPVGAAIAGAVSEVSISAAILLAVVAGLLAAGLAAVLVPRTDPSDPSIAAPDRELPPPDLAGPAPAQAVT